MKISASHRLKDFFRLCFFRSVAGVIFSLPNWFCMHLGNNSWNHIGVEYISGKLSGKRFENVNLIIIIVGDRNFAQRPPNG